MADTLDRPNDSLNDSDLLDREADQRDEFLRLEESEPHLRDTTYRVMNGSRPLLRAWDRWLRTSVAARLRGLLARGHSG